MKKLIYLILAIPLLLMFSSCEKQKYCAQCYENISGYQAKEAAAGNKLLKEIDLLRQLPHKFVEYYRKI